jgi:hypothetical protein
MRNSEFRFEIPRSPTRKLHNDMILRIDESNFEAFKKDVDGFQIRRDPPSLRLCLVLVTLPFTLCNSRAQYPEDSFALPH